LGSCSGVSVGSARGHRVEHSPIAGEQPEVSWLGIVLAIVSLIVVVVAALAREKRRVGREMVEAASQWTQAASTFPPSSLGQV
jgi:hypothetical protein